MHADNWANKAKQEGYRTRAVYKLEEILQKTKSLKKSQNPNLYRIKWLGIRYLAASFVAFSRRNTTHNTAL